MNYTMGKLGWSMGCQIFTHYTASKGNWRKLNCCIKGPGSQVLLYVWGPTNGIPRKETNAAILETPARAKE